MTSKNPKIEPELEIFKRVKEALINQNFAILSASRKTIAGKPEEKIKTNQLENDLLSMGFETIKVYGRYKYEDGTLAAEPSIFAFLENKKEKLDKDFIQFLAEQFRQESYIFGLTLFFTKDDKEIKFNTIILGKDALKEENYTQVFLGNPKTAFAFK